MESTIGLNGHWRWAKKRNCRKYCMVCSIESALKMFTWIILQKMSSNKYQVNFKLLSLSALPGLYNAKYDTVVSARDFFVVVAWITRILQSITTSTSNGSRRMSFVELQSTCPIQAAHKMDRHSMVVRRRRSHIAQLRRRKSCKPQPKASNILPRFAAAMAIYNHHSRRCVVDPYGASSREACSWADKPKHTHTPELLQNKNNQKRGGWCLSTKYNGNCIVLKSDFPDNALCIWGGELASWSVYLIFIERHFLQNKSGENI